MGLKGPYISRLRPIGGSVRVAATHGVGNSGVNPGLTRSGVGDD